MSWKLVKLEKLSSRLWLLWVNDPEPGEALPNRPSSFINTEIIHPKPVLLRFQDTSCYHRISNNT
jgi:hypothetical protein